MRNPKLFVDGVEVGRMEAEPTVRTPEGEITITLAFKPNWPGLWHLSALALDKPRR